MVGPDEPRYAAIARAMAETHDWVTPRLWGSPWFEKPVLYYWCAGFAMRVFSVGEFAARLPAALAALLAVVSVKWTALRSYGIGAAWFALLMLPASVAMIGFSRAAGPDMLLAGLLTAAMAVGFEMLQTSRPGPVSQIAFGFLLGAAALAKGPAAVVLAGGATLLWAAVSRQWRAPFRFLHPWVIAAFCATALPWYVLCALRNPDFLHVFIWHHNFERYLTPVFEHDQPIWYYGPILLVAIFPWILFPVGAIPKIIRSARSEAFRESPGLFFACWVAFPAVFFSLSKSKLPGYILPAVPPIFLLLGRWASQSAVDNPKALPRILGWTGILLFALANPVVFGMMKGVSIIRRPEYVLAAGIALAFGTAIAILAFRKLLTASLIALLLMVVSIVLVANWVVLPRLDSRISARPLAQRLKAAGASGNDIATYELARNWQYGMDFYFNRELPEWTPGAGEPKWILAGTPPDHQFLGQYELDVSESSPETGHPIFLLRHR